MKLHFDKLFTILDSQVVVREEVTSSGVRYNKGEALPVNTTLFGVPFVSLTNHEFEVTGSLENPAEIKAYYVR